jgi:heat shock protein HslJ
MNLMNMKYPVLLLTLLALFFLTACGGSGGEAPDLDGTEWGLIEMNGEAIQEDVEITIAFSEGQISGQSACNRYFAGYTQEGTALTFDQAGSSNMFCEGLMDLEGDYLQTLSEVKSFELKDDIMTLKNESGEATLVFSK